MKKDILKQGKSFINEFKDFISRGNVLDMAVGVIIYLILLHQVLKKFD